jgi:bacteriorhodopsin
MFIKSVDDNLIKNSFYMSYMLLITTGTITLIEALRTNDKKIRHIMNIETCISIIAGVFYSKFIKTIEERGVDFKKINEFRYMDWFTTTPLMLLGLGLVLTYNLKISFKFKSFIIMVLLNYGMLIIGYLGEIGKINKQFATLGGFVLFGFLFYYIYSRFIKGKKNIQNTFIYYIFVIFWGIYGIAFLAEPKLKNLMYNVLDVFAKCFVGIGFWAYLSGIFK